jgi:phage minor structural protein
MIIPKNIIVKNPNGQVVAYLSPKADGLKEVFVDTRLNGESTLEFQLPLASEKWAELTPECTIWAGGKVFSMLKDEAVDTVRDENNKLWAKYMAVERWAELDSQYIEPYISNDPIIPIPADLEVIIVSGGSNLSGGLYTVGSAGHALYAVLNGSGWTVGTVDVTSGVRDLQTEKISRLQLIKEIQDKWGGYLVFDSANKTVSLRNPNTWQNYTGFQIRYKKNLKHITRTQSNKIVTKLYAFGHDGLLDIASVNGGLKYITNYSYTPRTYTGIYKNQDIYTAAELLEKAAAELALICRPRYLYKTKMVDLRTLPEYSHEDFAVGDMADVIDPDVAPESPRPRIIRHKYNLFQPWICEVEIGDPQERLIEKLKASFGTTGFVDGKYNGNGQSSGRSIEDLTITNAKIKDLSADKITAGTITATISIVGPTITGGAIQTATSGKRIKIFNNQLNSLNGNTKEGFSIEQYNAGGYTAFCGLMYRNGSILGGLVDFNDGALTIYSNANLGTYGQDLVVSGGKSLILKNGPYGIVCVGSATANNTVVVQSVLESYVAGYTYSKSYIDNNFASDSHTHGNYYIRSGNSSSTEIELLYNAELSSFEVYIEGSFAGYISIA